MAITLKAAPGAALSRRCDSTDDTSEVLEDLGYNVLLASDARPAIHASGWRRLCSVASVFWLMPVPTRPA